MHILFLVAALALTSPAEAGTLQAGAARVDITPPPDAGLPMSGYSGRKQGSQKIHDPLNVRAIVLHDGTRHAAIVVWELIGVPNAIWSEVSERISKEAGIAPENLLFAGVHSHSAPSPSGMYGNADPKSVAYTEKAKAAALEAVQRAKAALQPAKVGSGSGKAYVNINRRELTAGGWQLGYNPEFPSDKTLGVVRFESLSGKPIALLINYPVHAVVMGQANLQISGDIAGATSRFVERYYTRNADAARRGDAGAGLRLRKEETETGVVAIWTSGAAGDQNPISVEPGEDFTMVEALGRIMGEEAVRVSSRIQTTAEAEIRGVHRVISCPGRRLAQGPRTPGEFKFEDADPVSIRLGLLAVNQTVLAGVSGEVLNGIARRLRSESPFSNTIMVTHANGSSGYIPDDASFGQISYEITASRLKPGCAEGAIVDGFLEMLRQGR